MLAHIPALLVSRVQSYSSFFFIDAVRSNPARDAGQDCVHDLQVHCLSDDVVVGKRPRHFRRLVCAEGVPLPVAYFWADIIQLVFRLRDSSFSMFIEYA